MLSPSEVNLKQGLFIKNFNLLAEVCTKLGEPIRKISSDGLCDGLTKKRLFDAYQANDGELLEFDAYMAYINRLTPKSIQALANKYTTNKNFVIEFVGDYKLTFGQLLRFAQSVNLAHESQEIAPFKSFAANWDDSFSFVCKKSCLPEFLTVCQFDTFPLLYFGASDHAFAKPYSTIYDANNPKKAWAFSTAGKTREEQAAEVASIINKEILDYHTQSNYVGLCLNSLSYGNARRELDDLLNENRSIIQQQPSLLSYIEEYERGNLSRMQLALVLNETIDSNNPNLIKLKNELSRICAQQIITIEKLITLAEGDINAQDSNGYSWLLLAVCNNQITWAKALIKAGAEIDAHTNNGVTPLYSAALHGLLEIVKLLVAQGAKLDVPRTDTGSTPVYVAAQKGYLEIVKVLAESGANLNSPRKDGSTPLYFAAQKGHLEIVKLLVAKGAKLNSSCTNGAIPLHIAVQQGHLEIVQLLVDQGSNVNASRTDGVTPLHIAACNGYLEIAKVLVAKDAKIDATCAYRITPLYAASQSKQLEVVKFLLEQGADIDAVCSKDGSTPFHVAIFNGDIPMVTMLLEKGADINKPLHNGKTPLAIASSKGHTEIKLMIEQYKNAEAVLLQAKAKIKAADPVAVKISKVFSAFAYPPMFSMIWRNEQEKKCAANIAKKLLENPTWSFDDCKKDITKNIKTEQWSGLAGLLKQLDKFASEQVVSIQNNNPKAI